MATDEHGGEPPRELVAYCGPAAPRVTITPAPRTRIWIPDTPGGSARRCLPLLMANQAGWFLGCQVAVRLVWDGSNSPDGVAVDFAEPVPLGREPVRSTFGHGIVSFLVPYLFRTPPGWDLLARGPANLPKDGIAPLEGLVETDWSVATFTMNWQLTRPDHPVEFAAGEPFCMIAPQRRDTLANWRPVYRSLDAVPETARLNEAWSAGRTKVKVAQFAREHGYELDEDLDALALQYFHGYYPDGTRSAEHRTSIRLPAFEQDGQF